MARYSDFDKIIKNKVSIPNNIPEIGHGTLAILRSQGITTNVDIIYHSFEFDGGLDGLPGIGPGRNALLQEWANSTVGKEEFAQIYTLKENELSAQRDKQAELDKQNLVHGCWIVIIFVAVVYGSLFLMRM